MSTYPWSLNGLPGKVGPLSGTADGGSAQLRLSKDCSLVVRRWHGYNEAVYRGRVFFASNQAGIVPTAGLSATSTVYTLYNPAGSNVNLVLLETLCTITAQTAISTTASVDVFWAGNLNPNQAAPASVTAEAVNNALVSVISGAGKVYNTATLAAAPVAIRPLFSTDRLSSVGAGNLVVKDDVGGALIVPPGIYISIQASAATVALQCSATWMEEPI